MSGAESGEEEVAPPKVCTPELLKEKMSNIGPTFDGTAFAFLTLDLEDAELINLSPEQRTAFDWTMAAIQFAQTLLYLICIFVPQSVDNWHSYSRITPKIWSILIIFIAEASPVLTAGYFAFDFS